MTIVILVSLLLGVITTVGAAWGAAWRFNVAAASSVAVQSNLVVPATSGDRVSLEVADGPGCRMLIWSNHDFLGAPGTDLSDVFTGDHPIDMPTLAESTPAWSRIDLAAYRQTISEAWVFEFAFGWPSRTMYAIMVDAPKAQHASIVGNVAFSQSHVRGPGLPLCPIWLPFLRDAALFMLIWLIVIETTHRASRAVIAHRRQRGGRCSQCGYMLDPETRSERCPECGSIERGNRR